jgi:hypothetical protein
MTICQKNVVYYVKLPHALCCKQLVSLLYVCEGPWPGPEHLVGLGFALGDMNADQAQGGRFFREQGQPHRHGTVDRC